MVKLGHQSLPSRVPHQLLELSIQQSQSLLSKRGLPRIEKYRVSAESELAVSSGESGSVWPGASDTGWSVLQLSKGLFLKFGLQVCEAQCHGSCWSCRHSSRKVCC